MYLLGLDLGTSGAKALAVSPDGSPCGWGYQGYTFSTQGERVEQNPQDWLRSLQGAIREALKGLDRTQLVALALSTQGASSLLIDREGRPLTQAITWMDRRSVAEALVLEEELGAEAVYRRTGWEPDPNLDASKLRHLVLRHGDLVRRAFTFGSTLEYVQRFLIGKPVIDPTNAAIRQLYNLHSQDWDPLILDWTGAPRELLPEIRPTGVPLGTLTPQAADYLGLPRTVRVYNGIHDQYAAALGTGTVEAGDLLVSTGTAWVLLGITQEPLFAGPGFAPGPMGVPGLWGLLSSLDAVGAQVDTLIRERYQGDYEALERAPEDLHQAMVSPVVELVHRLETYERLGFKLYSLRLTGGATASPSWNRRIAERIPCRVYRSTHRDSAVAGAAVLAALGEGWFCDPAAAAAAINPLVSLHG